MSRKKTTYKDPFEKWNDVDYHRIARRIAEEFDQWSEKAIVKQQKEMAKAAVSIWRI